VILTWATSASMRALRRLWLLIPVDGNGPTNLAKKVERRGAELSRHQCAVMITGHRYGWPNELGGSLAGPVSHGADRGRAVLRRVMRASPGPSA
jgi:hypothetical protein